MRYIGIIALICALFWATGSCLIVKAEPQCPEGQWYNPELGRCVVPGDGDSNVDSDFKTQLRAECQFPCGDGWCCPNDYSCPKCDRLGGKDKTRCYKQYQCWRRQ